MGLQCMQSRGRLVQCSYSGVRQLMPASYVQSQGPGQQANGVHHSQAAGLYATMAPPEHAEPRKGAQQNGHASSDQGPPAPAGVNHLELCIWPLTLYVDGQILARIVQDWLVDVKNQGTCLAPAHGVLVALICQDRCVEIIWCCHHGRGHSTGLQVHNAYLSCIDVLMSCMPWISVLLPFRHLPCSRRWCGLYPLAACER